MTSNGTQLFVAHALNHRVLVFDTFPVANGAAASKVLGQSNFSHVTRNDDDQDDVSDGPPSARTFNEPSGVYHGAGDRLYVTDEINNRVLVFQGL